MAVCVVDVAAGIHEVDAATAVVVVHLVVVRVVKAKQGTFVLGQ